MLAGQFGGLAVDVIKLDIEGAESLALDGMARTLAANDRLALVTELWLRGFERAGRSARAFLDRLSAAGFALAHIDEDEGRVYAVDAESMLGIAASLREGPRQKGGGWACRRGAPVGHPTLPSERESGT